MRGGKHQRRRVSSMEKRVREGLTLRIGTVTDDSPLTITLGGSAAEYGGTDGLHTLGGSFAVDDQVAVLVWGNDMLVLGVIA